MTLKIVFTDNPKFNFFEKSEEIGRVQEILQELGYDIGISGVDKIYGKDTKKALDEFILKGTVQQNGTIGTKTLYALQDKSQRNLDGYLPLSWEKLHFERVAWSKFTIQTIESLFDNSFSLCEDITRFRSNYHSLNRTQKINVWAELISAICKHESGWEPTSRYVESNFKELDSVTKKTVVSEGLMQLSYQDKNSYPDLPCRFNWALDKSLNDKDPNKTILKPEINLEFGINVLAKQIRRTKKIALTENVYWAVLKDGGKYSKIYEIISDVEALKV